MKRFLSLFFVFSLSIPRMFAQEIPATPEVMDEMAAMEMAETVECPLSREQLYTNAQHWIIGTFGDCNSSVLSESDASGRLVARGSVNLGEEAVDYTKNFSTKLMTCTVTIECENQSYRYKITEIDLQIVQYNANFETEFRWHISPSYHRFRAEILAMQFQEELAKVENSAKSDRRYIKKSAGCIKRAEKTRKEMLNALDEYYQDRAIVANLVWSLKKAMAIENDQ